MTDKPTGTPCRLLECADGARTPVTGDIFWFDDDEIATRNRALVETTQRWWPLPAAEREKLMHEVGVLPLHECIHGRLKRKCELCELQRDCDDITSELNNERQEILRLQAALDVVKAEVVSYHDRNVELAAECWRAFFLDRNVEVNAFQNHIEALQAQNTRLADEKTELEKALRQSHTISSERQGQVEHWKQAEAEAVALVLSHEAKIAALESRNKSLVADVDFAARKLMPAHDLFAELLTYFSAYGQNWDDLRGRIEAWMGRKPE